MTLSDTIAYQNRVEVLFTDEHAEACAMNFVVGYLMSAANAHRTVDPQILLDAMLERAETVHERNRP